MGCRLTIQEAVSYAHGRQTFQFGGIFQRQIAYQIQYAPTTMPYSNLTQFLNNTPNTVQIQLHGDPALRTLPDGSPAFKNTMDQYGAYIQDDVKVTKSLTLNLGVRYDYFTVPVEVKNRAYNRYLDPAHPELGPGFGPIINLRWVARMQASMMTCKPAARAFRAASSWRIPSCIQTTFAPILIASSTTGGTSSGLRKTCTTSTFSGMEDKSG